MERSQGIALKRHSRMSLASAGSSVDQYDSAPSSYCNQLSMRPIPLYLLCPLHRPLTRITTSRLAPERIAKHREVGPHTRRTTALPGATPWPHRAPLHPTTSNKSPAPTPSPTSHILILSPGLATRARIESAEWRSTIPSRLSSSGPRRTHCSAPFSTHLHSTT